MLDRKGPAGVGAIRVNRAARIGQERTGPLLISRHAQENVGEIVAFAQNDIDIAVDKLIGTDAEALFQPNHIIRIQKQI
jgi:hypothetical protein